MHPPKKILLADDDAAILDATRMILELEGYEVLSTLDGGMVEQLLEEKPDLLLLDIWMGGHDGKEICRGLKAGDETKHLPIILISASRDVARSALDAGADDFIAKPYQLCELLAKVDKHVSLAASIV